MILKASEQRRKQGSEFMLSTAIRALQIADWEETLAKAAGGSEKPVCMLCHHFQAPSLSLAC